MFNLLARLPVSLLPSRELTSRLPGAYQYLSVMKRLPFSVTWSS